MALWVVVEGCNCWLGCERFWVRDRDEAVALWKLPVWRESAALCFRQLVEVPPVQRGSWCDTHSFAQFTRYDEDVMKWKKMYFIDNNTFDRVVRSHFSVKKLTLVYLLCVCTYITAVVFLVNSFQTLKSRSKSCLYILWSSWSGRHFYQAETRAQTQKAI